MNTITAQDLPEFKVALVLENNKPNFYAVLENKWGGKIVFNCGNDKEMADRTCRTLNDKD